MGEPRREMQVLQNGFRFADDLDKRQDHADPDDLEQRSAQKEQANQRELPTLPRIEQPDQVTDQTHGKVKSITARLESSFPTGACVSCR